MGGIEFVGLNRFWVTKCTFVFTGPCFPRLHIERTVFCWCLHFAGGGISGEYSFREYITGDHFIWKRVLVCLVKLPMTLECI